MTAASLSGRRAGLEDGGIPARVIDELMGHSASRSQDRSGSTIGLRYRHMTPAMQARVVTVIGQHMATALAGMPCATDGDRLHPGLVHCLSLS